MEGLYVFFLLAFPSYALCQIVFSGHLRELGDLATMASNRAIFYASLLFRTAICYGMDRTDAYTDRPGGYSEGIAATD